VADPLDLRFTLTRAEYAAGARAASDRLIRAGAVIGTALLALGIAVGLSALTVAGALVVVIAVVAWLLPWVRWSAEPSLHEEEHWVVNETGCVIERPGSRTQNRWAHYREATAAGPVYALLSTRGTVDAIPKRALGGAAEGEFVALVRAHVTVRETSPSTGWTD
jgi:hypothetical protein